MKTARINMKRVGGAGKEAAGKVGGFFKDFKDFINKGNVVDLAVAVILGAAFNAIVKSLVADIFNPLIGLMGRVSLENVFVILRYGNKAAAANKGSFADYSTYNTIELAHEAGCITMNYGRFIETIIYFVIVAFCLFIVVKLLMLCKKKEEAAAPSTDWACPKCMEMVKEGAVRCPHCAAEPIQPPPAEATDDEKNELLTAKA